MANTYTQLFVHLVFAVKNRGCFIAPSWQQELYAYIIGVIENRHHKVYAIGGMRDHIPVFVSMLPTQSVSELVHVSKVVAYIQNQKQHHVGKTMQEEYIEFLKLFGVEYDEKYVFQPVE